MIGSPNVSKSKPKPVGSWRTILFKGRSFTLSSNDFKNRPSGINYSLGYHTGQDISMSRGTPVHSPLSGVVVASDRSAAYGNNVLIRLKDGNYLFFAHLDSKGLYPGDTVKAGTFVGRVGSTGTKRSGSHLHMEVRTKASGGRFGAGNFMDPIAYLDGKKNYNVQYTAPTTSAKSGGGGGSSSTSSGGGGGGGGGGVAGFSKKDYYQWLDANFGSIAILREMDGRARKELGGQSIDWMVDQLAAKKITDPSIVATYMNQTGWFKKYGAEASLRLVAEKQRPAFFKQQMGAHTAEIRAALGQLGVTLSSKALNSLARSSYIYNWSAAEALDEAQRLYSKTGDVTYDGGTIGEAQDSLEEAAYQLGVTLSNQDLISMRQDIIDGKGYQSQLDDLRERSAKLYTVYAEQIRAGQSLRGVAGAYFDKAAELLELGSPDQVDMNDPLFRGGKAFMAPDPKTGKMMEKGMWDFEKEIRKDPRWLKTENAHNDTFGAADSILQLMGLR